MSGTSQTQATQTDGTQATGAATGQATQTTATTTQATGTDGTQQTGQTTTEKATQTVLDDTSTQTQQAAPTWRDDWRVAMAKGNEGLAKKLDRYASPEAVAEALENAQKKISSGQLKSAKPDGTDPAALKAWREENGIPETHDKYDLNLSNGLVLGEADKPMADSFLKHAHSKDWTPQQVKEGLEWYHAFGEQVRDQTTQKDAQYRKDAEDALRQEWGQEYRINQRVLKESLEAAGMLDDMLGARGADGRLLLANPKIVRYFVSEAREKNPHAATIGGGSAAVETATNRLADLTKMMGDYSGDYWKGPNSAKLQEEYRRLSDAVEGTKARAA